MKKFLSLLASASIMLSVLVGCSETSTASGLEPIAKEDIKVGFVYVGPVGDEGYTDGHDKGRQALEAELGVETVIVESVPENSDCETAVRMLISQGCNVIYATSFGHMDWVAKVAQDYPNVYFSHATGYTQLENMSNYMGRVYEPRYLSGIAAGLNTETNKIGYVAAMPIPEVIRGINAFALGVKSVNPDATIEVKWTNSWYDPTLEKTVAIDLINSGADVLAQHCDTAGPIIAAAEAGVYAVGYNTPQAEIAPDAYLTAPLFNWGAYYIDDVTKIIDGTWESRSYYEGLNSGTVAIDEINENAAKAGTADAVRVAQDLIESGELYVFDGPIYDNQGNLMVADGEAMSDAEILSFDWFVDNVIGNTN